MKTLTALLLTLFLCVGCRSRYDLTLGNGNKIEGVTKPKLDPETRLYHFKMGDGIDRTVNASRVRAITPHGESPDVSFKDQKK